MSFMASPVNSRVPSSEKPDWNLFLEKVRSEYGTSGLATAGKVKDVICGLLNEERFLSSCSYLPGEKTILLNGLGEGIVREISHRLSGGSYQGWEPSVFTVEGGGGMCLRLIEKSSSSNYVSTYRHGLGYIYIAPYLPAQTYFDAPRPAPQAQQDPFRRS